MNWKTAMQVLKGILSGIGIIAGIAAIASSAAFGRTLSSYLANGTPDKYSGIPNQAVQAATDALGAGMVFYDSVRALLLFLGIGMICFFGILLAETLKSAPVDVLVDSPEVDTFRRRLAHSVGRLAHRLDPDAAEEVVSQQEELPLGEAPIEFVTAEPPEEVPAEKTEQTGN